MKFLLIIIFVAIIIYFFAKASKRRGASKMITITANSQNKSKLANDLEWLKNRWNLAEDQKQSGLPGIFPQWYFDEVTENQLNKLDRIGLSVERGNITKGQASDLIGMYESVEEESLEILKFFKVPTRGMNQTKARHEIALIFNDDAKAKAWKNRPLSQTQKEFFKFFDIKYEADMTNTEASNLISDYESELAEKEDSRLDEWEAFEEIIDELTDPDFREDYEIKKPNISLVKNALDCLRKEGKSYRDAADDIDLIVDKMIELNPKLKRN